MDQIISQLIDDFQQRKIPDLLPRSVTMPVLEGKASVIIGMRRVGKTFFCYQKIGDLLKEKVAKDRILYINFEDDRLIDFSYKDFQTILEVYFKKYPENIKKRCYFFFDEIQEIDKWEYFVRRLLDSQNIQIFLTGSSAKLLSREIATQLRGRSLAVEIFPLSFSESLRYFNLQTKNNTSLLTSTLLQKRVEDYLFIGGFPEVQLVESDIRTQVLQEYIDIVLLRDIIERNNVSNTKALRMLVSSLVKNPGDIFSVNKFYNTLKTMGVKCSKDALYDYLDFLVDAYLFYKVPLHTWSERVRQVNPPKIYTIDTGLLVASDYSHSNNLGKLLENFVFLELRRKLKQIEYWKSEDGYEVDFYVQDNKMESVLIQVCVSLRKEATRKREIRGLQSAMTHFRLKKAFIVTLDEEEDLGNGIQVIPVKKWLLNKNFV